MIKTNNLKTNLGGIFEQVAVGVHKDFGRRGIGGHLTRLMVKNAADKGFYFSFAECTSLFSSRALEKHGGKVEKSILYKDFEYTKSSCCSKTTTKPLEKAEAPHT